MATFPSERCAAPPIDHSRRYLQPPEGRSFRRLFACVFCNDFERTRERFLQSQTNCGKLVKRRRFDTTPQKEAAMKKLVCAVLALLSCSPPAARRRQSPTRFPVIMSCAMTKETVFPPRATFTIFSFSRRIKPFPWARRSRSFWTPRPWSTCWAAKAAASWRGHAA